MATKANPGKYDCYDTMPDDEPHFVLRATGATSPGLVRIWAAIKAGNFREAHNQLQILQKRRQAEMKDGNNFDGAKVAEALLCANDMEIYAGKGEDEPAPTAEENAEQDLKEGFDDEVNKDRTTMGNSF